LARVNGTCKNNQHIDIRVESSVATGMGAKQHNLAEPLAVEGFEMLMELG
jgi:hypothetical protein